MSMKVQQRTLLGSPKNLDPRRKGYVGIKWKYGARATRVAKVGQVSA